MNDPKDTPPGLRDLWSAPRRLDVIWYILPATLTLAGFGLLPLRSWDYWWHITIGRLINAWSAIPAANHYLYTMASDAPSFVQPWLSQLLLYGTNALGSVHLTLLVRNLMIGAAVVLLTRSAVRRTGAILPASLATLAALPFLFTWVEARPHLFAWPLFLGLLATGYRVRRGQWPIWALAAFPAAGAFWANLHGSFPLAIALAGVFGVAAAVDSEDRENTWKPWALALPATAAATLLNPQGTGVWNYVGSMATHDVVQRSVTEWLPTTLSNPPVIGVFFYITVLGGAALLWWRREQVDTADALLFALFAVLGALQARAQLWWGFVLPLTVTPALRGLWNRQTTDAPPLWLQRVHALVGLALFAAALLFQPYWQWRIDWTAESEMFDVRPRPPMEGVVPRETPFEAAEILGRRVEPLRMFHDEKYAGFLLYHLSGKDPRQIVFVDHRIELPSERIWEMYRKVSQGDAAWKGVFHQYDLRAAVISLEDQAKLIDRLEAAEPWKRIIQTDGWAFYLRDRSPR